ncbi:uncharacterized protein DUF4345 [Nocardiopsis sp. Huas11]|uniref:DUF4345 domain-containing protein n=1 Tax=Nocardiopsis sp. Huas11 TaxID=2183912 RepID=UPI000F25E8A8|nr:DUF4345 domain-containing protein [Nocardiopsis sp. Huas11]RKS05303.1 uncharacterized protein DUF4345 [Nocardiopsis sp. Huas11]
MRNVRAFQSLVLLSALVVLCTGAMDVALGTAPLPGDDAVPVNVDSNYRFFAAVWLTLGVALVIVAARVREPESTPLLRLVCAAVLLGGVARVWSIVVAGVPDPMLLALLGVELVLPPVLLLWHRALTRGAAPTPSPDGRSAA